MLLKNNLRTKAAHPVRVCPDNLPKIEVSYALEELDVISQDDPFLRAFAVSYTDGEGFVNIDIMSYEGEPATQIQKIDGPAELMEKNGVMFYHIENSVGRTIAWCSDQYAYYLTNIFAALF